MSVRRNKSATPIHKTISEILIVLIVLPAVSVNLSPFYLTLMPNALAKDGARPASVTPTNIDIAMKHICPAKRT